VISLVAEREQDGCVGVYVRVRAGASEGVLSLVIEVV